MLYYCTLAALHTNQDTGVSIFVVALLAITRSGARISLPLGPRLDSNLDHDRDLFSVRKGIYLEVERHVPSECRVYV